MLSLPLAKLSTADDTDPAEQKFTWQHAQNDLSFVLDTYGAISSSQLLKVVQGTQVRQTIEIELLIAEGARMIKAMQDHGVELKADQLPVSAIVRSPLLAVRWQLPNKKIRRAQLKFKTGDDFEIAYNRLRQLGLHMTSPNGLQVPKENGVLAPVEATSFSARPHSAAAPYTKQSSGEGLSCPPHRLMEISNRPYTAIDSSTSVGSQSAEVSNMRPASARSSFSGEERKWAGFSSDPLVPPMHFPRPDSATFEILGHSSGSSATPAYSPPRPSSQEHVMDARFSSETINHSSRPNSAETILPPRRELPFQRSSLIFGSENLSLQSFNRPSTFAMGPPPLPAHLTKLRPASSPGAHRDMELPPLPTPTIVGQQVYQGSSALKHAETRPSSSDTISSSTTFPRNTGKGKMHAAVPTSFSRAQSPLHNMSPNIATTGPASDDASQYGVQRSVSSLPRSNEDDNLSAYVQQPDEERRAALNEFLFNHLENNGFLTLVEDMEACWARATLGMR